MADLSIYNNTAPSEGTVGLAHERILRIKRNGAFENVTGDINNFLDTPTPVKVTRENYGNKGTQAGDKFAENYVLTFTVEMIRAANGMFVVAQAWAKALMVAARSTGSANKVEAQWFDAKDDEWPAFQGTFMVEGVEQEVTYTGKRVIAFTLTSDGVVEQITSPIATSVPIIETVLPSGQTVGDVIYIKGYKFTGTTGVTIDAQTVTEYRVIDDNTIAILIPSSVSGAAAVVVTNAAGASDPYSYTAA